MGDGGNKDEDGGLTEKTSDNDDKAHDYIADLAGSLRELIQDTERGLLILPEDGSNPKFTESRYQDKNLFGARHTNDLVPSEESLYLRIDAAQRGMGTGICGPQTWEGYWVGAGTYRVTFWVNPIGIL